MRKNKIYQIAKQMLALVLTLSLVLGLTPAMPATTVQAASNGLPKEALTATANQTLKSDRIYCVETNITINGGANQAGLIVGSTAYIYIAAGCTLTVKGGNASSNSVGGQPGIYLPSGRTLYVTGEGTLKVTGGAGARAGDGGGGGSGAVWQNPDTFRGGDGGNGGRGASGGGAGIGTAGAAGGDGGSGGSGVTYDCDEKDHAGANGGSDGSSGSSSASAGTLLLYGAVKVDASGGSSGSSGSGGSAGGNAQYKWSNTYFAAGGGGGGGGGAAGAASGIGAGGPGGGGGAGGGSGATNYSKNNTYILPGNGGSGGSSGGSSGTTGSSTITGSNYKKGGSGGSGGGQGNKGSGGTVKKDKDVNIVNMYSTVQSGVGSIVTPPYPTQFTYQVTPDNNKGSGSTEPQGAAISADKSKVSLGYPVDCSDGWSVPTRVGYTFAGYNEKWDGTGREYVKYHPDAPVGENFEATGRWNVASDTIIYAQWTPNPYKVLLNRNNAATPAAITDSDGSGNMERYTTGTTEVTAYFDQTMPEGIEIPQRVGYTFLGYYEAPVADDVDDAAIDPSNTQYYDKDGKPTTATWTKAEDNHVLYARWKRTTYTIEYEPNGGTLPEDPEITKTAYTYGDTYDLPSDVNKSEGKQDYIFEGWYLNAKFTTDQIKTIYPANFGNKKYYAKWTPIKGTRADSELLTIPAGTFPYIDPVTGEEKPGKKEDYDHTQVYTLINGKPAQVDRVELRSGSGPEMKSYVCASDDTGAYGYYSKGSIGRVKIYINGRDTGKTVKSDSNEEIALATAEVTVSKDDVLLTGADVQLRRTDENGEEIIHYLTNNEDGTYSYLWLSDLPENEYHIYVNGEDSGKSISLVGGEKQNLSYYTIQVQTKHNDSLSEVGPVVLRTDGETPKELALTETEKDSGIFEIVSVEDPTVYRVYVDDEKTGKNVSFTSYGRNALQDYYDVEVTTRKDGAPSYIGKVELKSGDTVLAVNGADGNYSVRGQLDATTSYDIYVDGADSGQDARFTSSERRHTIDYYTVTVNVTRNGEPINEKSGVTLKAPGRSSIPLTWMDTGVYNTVQPASDTTYQIWFGSENTGRTVKFQPGNNTATIDYYGLTLNLREDGAVVSGAAITLVADGAIVASFEFNTEDGSYQSQIRGAGTYDIYRNGADTGADFVVSSTNKEASVDYYTVSYDGGGADAGQTLVAPYLVREGAEVTVTSQRLTKSGETGEGYNFGGWKRDDEETIYKAKDTFIMPDHAVTLKAVWIANADCEAKWTYEASGSQVTEYGTMDQALEEAANKYGKVTVSIVKDDASVHVTTSAELKSAAELVIRAGQTLILNDGVTITNRGMIKNIGSISKAGSNALIQNEEKGVIDQSADGEDAEAGTIGCDVTGNGTIGFGTIASGATVTGARLWGAIENHGTIVNPSEIISDTGVFTNAGDGNLTIQTGNSLAVNGTLNNQGTLANAGMLELSEETTLINESGAQLTNTGTLTAKANGGKAAHIDNAGRISNGAGATITLQSMGGKSASMRNTGEVANAGVVSLSMAATLDTTYGKITNTGNGYVLAYRYVEQGETLTDTMDGETITFKPQVTGIDKVTGPHQVVYVYVTTEEQLVESVSVHLNGIQMGADITLNQNLILSDGASLWIPEGSKLEVSDTTTVTVSESSDGIQLDGTIWMHSKEADQKLVIADQKLDQSETGRIYYQFSASISETEKVLGINETFVLRASSDAQAGGVCTYTWYEKSTLGEQAIFAATGAALSFAWDPSIAEKTYFCRITWEDTERGVSMTADTPECKISSKSTTDVTLSAESLHVSEVQEGIESKFGADKASCNNDWIATIRADTGYQLPNNIFVTIGGVPVFAVLDYTYDPETGEITIKAEKIRGPIVITVKATPVSYQIRYDIQGAEGSPSLGVKQEDGSYVQTVSYKDALTLADVGTLTSPGAIFKGWAKDADATEPEYTPGQKLDEHFMTTQDEIQTLYAVWRVKISVDPELLKDTTTDPNDPNYGKSLLEIVSASALVYTGELRKPEFTLAEQEKPVEQQRFTVINEGGIDVGTYYVELTFTDKAYEYYEWPEHDGVIVSGAAMKIPYQIIRATNAFTSDLTCENIVYGTGTKLAPSATAKFGAVKYRYRTDESAEWSNTAPTNAGTYQVQAYVTGTANYTALESEPLTVIIERGVYPAPDTAKVKAVDETIEGKKDGRLSGLTTEMEYRKAGAVFWSAITVDILSKNGPRDLEAGDYEVRYAESENAEASSVVKLTVHPGRKLVATYQAETDAGIVTVATQETVWGGSVTPSAIEVPARTGYSSGGWIGQYENLETDVTLTAIYSSKYIKVTLDPNGGTLQTGENCIYESYGHGYYDPVGGAMSATSELVALPSKTGYTFLGYYTGKDDGTCYIGADGTITEEANNRYFTGDDSETAALYAHWQMTAYEFKIVKASDADVKVSGEGAYKSTIGYDDPRTITVAPTSESGFNGDPIYVYINGSVVDTVTMTQGSMTPIELSVNIRTLEKLGNVLISIGEEPVSHQITYKYADGDLFEGTEITSGMPEDTPYVFLEKSGLSGLVTPIRNGYTFKGWYRTADCSKGAVTTIPARTKTDVTLYAKWSRNKYQVTFESNGGTYFDGIQYTFSETEKVELPKAVTKTGYVFAGWYLSAALDGTCYSSIPAGMTGDLKFYAKWEDQICTVTKKAASGVTYHTLSASDQVKYGNSYIFTIEINSAYNGDNMEVLYYETGASGEVEKTKLTPVNGVYTISNVTTDITIQVTSVREIPLTPTMKIQRFNLDENGKITDDRAVRLDSFVVWGLIPVSQAHYEYRVAGSGSWKTWLAGMSLTGKQVGEHQKDFTNTELSGLTPGQEYEVRLVVTDDNGTEKASDPIAFLMPVKEKEPPKGAITGTIRTEEDGTAIKEEDKYKTFTVSLNEGSTSVAVLYGVGNGDEFEFTGLPDGEYNLVVIDDETQFQVTKMVTVKGETTVPLGIIVVKAEKQTKVVVKEDAPRVAVDQLNDVYDAVKNVDNPSESVKAIQEASARVASEGGILSLNLIAEKSQESEQKSILENEVVAEAVTDAAIAMSLNLTAEMVETYNDGSREVTAINDTQQKLLIAVPMEDLMKQLLANGTTLHVYREHENEYGVKTVKKMVEQTETEIKETGSLEGFYVDPDAGYLYLRANKFSTYAVVYENTTPETPQTPQTPSGSGGGGSVKPKDPVVAPPQTFDKNDPKDIDISWDDNKDPKQVTMDDKPLDPKDYKPGNKKLTFPKDYLEGLEPGDHTVIIYFDDGTSQKVVITVAEKKEPKPDKPSDSGDAKITVSKTFHKLPLAEAKATKNAVKVSWKKVTGADGYVLYGAPCNTKKHTYKFKKLAVIKNGKTTKYTNKRLKSGTYYKYYIKAYKLVNGKKVWLAKSKMIHVTTTGGKYGNAKAVKVNKTTVALKKGKSFKLQAAQVTNGKPIQNHAKIMYESTNKKIASVSSKGVIKAKKKGTCYIYVYAQNGVYKRVKVTVK